MLGQYVVVQPSIDGFAGSRPHEDSLQYTVSEDPSSLSVRHRRGSDYVRSRDMAYPVDWNRYSIRALLCGSLGDQLVRRGWAWNVRGVAQPAARGLHIR